MRSFLIGGLLFLGLSLFAQEEMELNNRLKLVWIEKNELRQQPQIGEYLTLNIEYRTANDSLLFTTASTDKGYIKVQMREPEFRGDMHEAFAQMHLLDSAHLFIPANTFFPRILKTNRPSDVDGRLPIRVAVRLRTIQTPQELAIEMNEMRELARKREPDRIAAYLNKIDFDGVQLPGGAYMQWLDRGTGGQPETNEKVKVMYVGEFLDGEVFDRSEVPLQVPVGRGAVIPAWDDALLRMKLGDRIRLIAPSEQAYGARGVPEGDIGPFEPLVFEMELVEIIR